MMPDTRELAEQHASPRKGPDARHLVDRALAEVSRRAGPEHRLDPAEEREIGRWVTRLFSRTSDAVFVVGPGARIVWWGPKAEEVLGVAAARALGRHCYDVFAGLSCSYGGPCRAACPRLQTARRGGVPSTMPIERVAGGGEKKPYTLGFIVDSSGEYLIHVVRERTPRGSTSSSSTNGPELQVPAQAAARSDGAATSDGAARSDPDSLTSAVQHLTPREREVLQLLMAGASSAAIARQLSISGVTVRNHVRNVLVKLNVHSRLEAAAVAHTAGLI